MNSVWLSATKVVSFRASLNPSFEKLRNTCSKLPILVAWMHTGIFVWSMLSYDNDDKLGLGGVCWWDDSIDSIEFHFIPHLLSFEFRASSLRWATGLHGQQRCRLDDSWLLTQPILTLKGPERLSRNCSEHQSFTSRCFIDTLFCVNLMRFSAFYFLGSSALFDHYRLMAS